MKQILSDFLNLCFPQKEGYQFTWKEILFGLIAISIFILLASLSV